MDSFEDHFNPLLGNGAIWTSMTNGNHKCRLCNKYFRCSITCNVKLSKTQNGVTRELKYKSGFQIS